MIWSSCLSLLSSGITCVCLHTLLFSGLSSYLDIPALHINEKWSVKIIHVLGVLPESSISSEAGTRLLEQARLSHLPSISHWINKWWNTEKENFIHVTRPRRGAKRSSGHPSSPPPKSIFRVTNGAAWVFRTLPCLFLGITSGPSLSLFSLRMILPGKF